MRILIADDQPEVTKAIADVLKDRGFEPVCVAKGEEAISKVKAEPAGFGLAILDYDFGRRKKNGLEAFKEIKALAPELPVVFLTGQGTVSIAVEAMKLGAQDFVEKDKDFAENLDLALSKVERLLKMVKENKALKAENAELKNRVDFYQDELYKRYSIVGSALSESLKLVERMAAMPRPVLIRGERGTGKELVAAAIHKASARKNGPFITVNCAALAEGLLECEIFGQEENCYPGAPFRRGRFELAHRGTLFLDEIGNMPLDFQQKILRVLEYQSFERVGGTQTIKVDVRVIGATNADMEADMRRGRFREDLYDRLAFETLRLPPLRERKEDIPVLAAHFLNAIASEIPGVVAKSFSKEALELMKTWAWPGNIRELKFYVERLAYRVSEAVIQPADLPPPRQLEIEEPKEFDLKHTVSKALTQWGPERVREELDVLSREMGLVEGKSPLKRFI